MEYGKSGRRNPLSGHGAQLHPASYNKRIIAGMIDGLILYFVVFTALQFVDVKTLPWEVSSSTRTKLVFFYCYFFLTVLPHHLFCQTLGQAVVGIKLIDADEHRLKLSNCLFRDVILRPLGILASLSSLKDGRAFHDKIAGSVVIEAT